MSFSARVFRILIASPSDVAEERDVAVQTIQEWNNLNSAERQIVLLPVRWETHSAPEFGKRPQEIINRQVVDYCDFLIGIFWSRIGTPSGGFDSATLEEIERIATAGKVVMLYFSKAKQDLDKVDLSQLAKLREFKAKTLPGALVENYSGAVEFKEKLSRQLEIQLRSILAGEQESNDAGEHIEPITDIVISFAEIDSGKSVGGELSIAGRYITIDGFDGIPDYDPSPQDSDKKSVRKAIEDFSDITRLVSKDLVFPSFSPRPNKDFYRQLLTYQVIQGFFVPIRFSLVNKGGVGARDVFIEINLSSSDTPFVVVERDRVAKTLPKKEESGSTLLGSQFHALRPDEVIRGDSDSWSTTLEVRALQPQRMVSPEHQFLVGATKTCKIKVVANIYADTLSKPVTRELVIDLQVSVAKISVDEFLGELGLVEK